MKKTRLGENLTTEMILAKKMAEMFMQIERNDYAKTIEETLKTSLNTAQNNAAHRGN